MPFDITSLQRNRGATQAKSRADEQTGRATLKYIDVYDLVPSEDNFYSMSAIGELASLIELSGGVKQPGLVVPMGGGKYRVIAGHRRRLASISLVEQGKEQFRRMPCMVEGAMQVETKSPEEAGKSTRLREIDEGILLIATNSQREKTDWERVQEATKLRDLLEQKRQIGRVSGQTRKIIAEKLGTTPAQVGRYESIARHLIPEFQEELAAGRVNISVAYELSTMSEAEQFKALLEYCQKRALSLEDVKRLKTKAPDRVEKSIEQPTGNPEVASPPIPPVENSGTPKAGISTQKRDRQKNVVRAEDGIDEMQLAIERLNDLCRYCSGMSDARDKTRNWAIDATMLEFAICSLKDLYTVRKKGH